MKEFNKKSIIMLVVSIAVGAVIANIPPFEGLTATSMTYLGIFVGMLIMLIANALPSWATCLGAMALMVAFQVGSLAEVFSAFGGSIVWLMIAVFAFATAIENSGLLTRLALKMLTIFPKNYRGQVLSLMTAGLVVSPLIPSNNAKTNLLAPMATEMTKQVGYEKRSKPALGLLTAVFMPPYIGSHAFLTGSANVAFMLGVVGLSFSWVGYLSLTWVWLILLLLGTYIFCMTYCRPKEKLNLPENYFSDKYQALGKMKKEEWVALVVVVACLALWISNIFDAGMVALLGAVVMSAFGILTPKDFQTRIPWGLIMFNRRAHRHRRVHEHHRREHLAGRTFGSPSSAPWSAAYGSSCPCCSCSRGSCARSFRRRACASSSCTPFSGRFCPMRESRCSSSVSWSTSAATSGSTAS